MNNIKEVREEMCKVFTSLRDGTLTGKEAKEMNNAAGKIISTLKVEIEHALACNSLPNIPFLEYDK